MGDKVKPQENIDTYESELKELSQADTGARSPEGIPAKMLFLVPFLWSLFQLWYASPLPYIFNFGILNDTEARSIHLGFAVFLAFVAFPAFKRSPRAYIPIQDWLFAFIGTFSALYIFLFYAELAERQGAPTTIDVITSVCGMLLLLEAARRALGPPLTIVASVFLCYTYFGPYMPDVIAHKGASLNKMMSHQWLTTEGVFGVALGVSTSFVFLFVLFGALLDKAGAGNYFIKMAFSLLGHMRGGPAKAAVVASGATGLISGSSIANVVTTGTFTIPLMKRVGFPGTKAGAVEVASSTNGQLTPPIMGAAAFLMVEYVGIPYTEVIKHAFLPAIISYIALIYIVHLEALKANMQGLPRKQVSTLSRKLFSFFTIFAGLIILSGLVYYGIGWIKNWLGDAAIWIICIAILVAYVSLVKYACRYPELKMDSPDADIVELPEVGPTVKSGLYYLLPVVLLIWCLMVERFSPGLSAFWATVFMLFIVFTQRPLQAYFRRDSANIQAAVKRGVKDFFDGMVSGARNMIGIGVATATAGIVVGTVTLTGIGLVMTEFVEFISGGNLLLILIFTALISLILGMGLPTTANYIVVSSLMAPVIVTLAAENGLIVPLIAAHMFVFYFGILADDTPPVGLAAFAAAAIARSDPIKTGIQGFAYDIRTAILPFMFIFNTQLLMINIDSWLDFVLVVVSAVIAMLTFAAATQGFWLVKSKWWETLLLLLVTFTLFRPGFFWDKIHPPIISIEPAKIIEVAEAAPDNGKLRFTVEGTNIDGDHVQKIVVLPLGERASGEERLAHAGFAIRTENEKVFIDYVEFFGQAQKAGIGIDWEITTVNQLADRPEKYWMFIPAFLLLFFVGYLQIRRRNSSAPPIKA